MLEQAVILEYSGINIDLNAIEISSYVYLSTRTNHEGIVLLEDDHLLFAPQALGTPISGQRNPPLTIHTPHTQFRTPQTMGQFPLFTPFPMNAL
jgi:hypothetical protein